MIHIVGVDSRDEHIRYDNRSDTFKTHLGCQLVGYPSIDIDQQHRRCDAICKLASIHCINYLYCDY